MPAFDAPRVVAAADQALRLAVAVVDNDADRLLGNDKIEIACHAGCSACCNQAVPVSPAEVRAIRTFIEAQPARRRDLFESRITSTIDRLADAGLNTDVPAPGDPARAHFVSRYFQAAVPCPLLEVDGTCGVRPVRPLACREYLVSSDPMHCTSLDSPAMVRLVSKRDAIAGFRTVSGAFGEPDVNVLALALARETPVAPAHGPLSGIGVVRLLSSTRRRPD